MDAPTQRVDQLFAEWDRPDSPGCVLAVVREGEIVYKRAYGMADLERSVPLSPASVFDLASTTKQFVAMCTLLLAQAGKLALDDDLRCYLPEMPGYGEPITIRHLIHHTSGIRDYLELMSLCGKRFENDTPEEEIIALLARQKELNFRPGDEFLYSNSGYFLLGEIIKRVTGQPLGAFAREQIFRPLGMAHTRFYDDFSAIVPNRAIGYAPGPDGGYRTELYLSDLVGDGGLLTCVADLALWDQNFYENRLGEGGPALIEEMLTPGRLNNGETLDYAFGLILGRYRGVPTVSHSGSWAGYRSELIRFPEQHTSVICLSNLSSFNPTGLAKQVADLYLEDAFPEARGGSRGDLVPVEADLEAKTGDFLDPESGMILKLSLEDGKLIVQHPAGPNFQIVPVTESQFRAVDAPVDISLTFQEPAGGQPMRLHVCEEDEKPITFEAVERISLDADALQEYAGDYYSEELAVSYRFLFRADRLVLKLGYDPEEPPLEPVTRDEFSLKDRSLRFCRQETGQIVGFHVRAGRVRNIWFVRQEPRTEPRTEPGRGAEG
jgi:CubicO group peptidase (beta-lactamase class C family)